MKHLHSCHLCSSLLYWIISAVLIIISNESRCVCAFSCSLILVSGCRPASEPNHSETVKQPMKYSSKSAGDVNQAMCAWRKALMVWTAVWKNIFRKKRMLRVAFERKGSWRHWETGMGFNSMRETTAHKINLMMENTRVQTVTLTCALMKVVLYFGLYSYAIVPYSCVFILNHHFNGFDIRTALWCDHTFS